MYFRCGPGQWGLKNRCTNGDNVYDFTSRCRAHENAGIEVRCSCGQIVMPYTVMAYVVMAYVVLADGVMVDGVWPK